MKANGRSRPSASLPLLLPYRFDQRVGDTPVLSLIGGDANRPRPPAPPPRRRQRSKSSKRAQSALARPTHQDCPQLL